MRSGEVILQPDLKLCRRGIYVENPWVSLGITLYPVGEGMNRVLVISRL
jgi:hypothetical protein